MITTGGTYRRRIVLAKMLAVAAILVVVPGCATKSGRIVSDVENMGAPPFSRFTENAGIASTESFSVKTPAGWRFSRLDPREHDGIVLVGNGSIPPAGWIEYTVQRIENDQDTEMVMASLYDYYSYRLGLLGGEAVMMETEIGGTPRQYIVGVNENEQIMSVPLFLSNEVTVLTVIGNLGAFALDGSSAVALINSYIPEPVTHRQRFDGTLPEFFGADGRWEWIRDLEHGFILAGRINEVPCIVTVVSVEDGDTGGAGGSATAGVTVFTGTATYRLRQVESNARESRLLLTGDSGSYGITLSWPLAAADDVPGSDDLLALVEHYLILDDAEVTP